MTTLNFSNFSNISSLKLNGSAKKINTKVIRLIDNESKTAQSGNFFTKNTISLSSNDSFSTSFKFQITDNQGFSQNGADGITFTLQPNSNDIVGEPGGSIGYGGITNSVAIEFDTYDNEKPNDNDGNHIGIDVDGSLKSIVQQPIKDDFNDGFVKNVWIDYNGLTDFLEVRISNNQTRPSNADLSYTLDIPSILGKTNTFIGFTSATGAETGDHDILSWKFDLSTPPNLFFDKDILDRYKR